MVGAWAAIVAVGIVWGASARGSSAGLGAAPFAGGWDVRLPPGLALAAAVAAIVVLAGPTVAARTRWRALVAMSGASAVAWAVALAVAEGWDRLTEPLTTRYEYEPFAATIRSAPDFVRNFVASVPDMPTHPKAHPPLATLVPWSLDRLGLAGAGWFAALAIAGWGVAVAAALVAARAVTGEAAARRAAPALVLLPAATWAATSADALFAGVLGAGVALAVARAGDRRWATSGGAVLGAGLLLSYGAVLALAVPAAVAWYRRRPGDLAATFAGVAGVLLVASLAGYWWPAGLAATRAAYWAGLAGRRPIAYLTLAGNPAALAIAIGPAVAVGLRHNRGVLPLAGLIAVAVADLSLLSAGEVERIWLPFMPWLALAAPGDRRRWLAAQAAVGLVLQSTLRSSW